MSTDEKRTTTSGAVGVGSVVTGAARGPHGRRSALIIVDVQHDFLPAAGAALPVPGGDLVIPIINRVREKVPFDLTVVTQDWHPDNHVSFYRTHGSNPRAQQGQTLEVPGPDGKPLQQMLWPVHCVQNTPGAEISSELTKKAEDVRIRKGTDVTTDSYSCFWDNGHMRNTELARILRDNFIQDVYICGLAYDYCVRYSAIDAINEGFRTFVIEDACRAITQDGHATAKEKMLSAGVIPTTSTVLTGERDEDPASTAAAYLNKHHINVLFEKLCASLIYHKPEKPREFLVEQLAILEKSGGLSLLTESDLKSVFESFDTEKVGKINGEKVKRALSSLPPSLLATVESAKLYSFAEFQKLAETV